MSNRGQNSIQTPLGRVRYLGSAKSGTRHFWHQRLTAVAMIPLTIDKIQTISDVRQGDGTYRITFTITQ